MNRGISLNGKRVLVVEDDYYLAQDAQDALERAGAKVIGPFASQRDALNAADPAQIDCALLDINLGGGPSFLLAEALEERRIPFLFVTGYEADVVPEKFRHNPRVEKPMRPADLLAAVEALG